MDLRQQPESPREALGAYILELEQEYRPWYEASSTRWKVIFGVGQSTALLAGVLASVLAAAANQAALQSTWFRITLVILPLLSSFAASIMGQMRARELVALRERGRAKIQEIISRAKANYAAAVDDPQRLSSLHIALVAEVDRLENDQATEFLSVAGADTGGGTSRRQASASTREIESGKTLPVEGGSPGLGPHTAPPDTSPGFHSVRT